MIRWPYKCRVIEGKKLKTPKIYALRYKWDCFIENLYIYFAPFPKSGIYTGETRKEKLIVSITTYPRRIKQVFYAIKSLMIQSYQADKIILWLAESQFPNKKLPKNIYYLEKKGLTIRWCDDLRSHKKYYYVLQEQNQNELVATFDDDIIYDYNAIKRLVETHNRFPNVIVCNRGCEITFDENKDLLPYSLKNWKVYSDYGVNSPGIRILPSSGAGCLYPYNIIPKVAFDKELIQAYSKNSDEVWIRFCSLSTGVKVIKTSKEIATLCMVFSSQGESLTSLNEVKGLKNEIISNLLTLFPNIDFSDN